MEEPRRSAILLTTDAAGRVLLVRQQGGPFAGEWLLPGGGVEVGESLEEALRREVREETGLRVIDATPLARYEVRGSVPSVFHLHVTMYRGHVAGELRAEERGAAGWFAPTELRLHYVLERQLRDGGLLDVPLLDLRRRQQRARILMTSLGFDGDDRPWYEEIRGILEEAYLFTDDVAAQSGKGGGLARWETCRSPIAAAIHRSGTFLDVGCANGLLMESVVRWASARGHVIEPYGLDLSERIAALARRRLPQWAGRVFVGNAIDWPSPMRFDFVRTELEYVPRYRAPHLVARLLGAVVARGGRLIVCGYGTDVAERVGETLRRWGFAVAGDHEGRDEAGRVCVRLAWVDA